MKSSITIFTVYNNLEESDMYINRCVWSWTMITHSCFSNEIQQWKLNSTTTYKLSGVQWVHINLFIMLGILCDICYRYDHSIRSRMLSMQVHCLKLNIKHQYTHLACMGNFIKVKCYTVVLFHVLHSDKYYYYNQYHAVIYHGKPMQ